MSDFLDTTRAIIEIGDLRVLTGKALQDDWSNCNHCGASHRTQEQFHLEIDEPATRLCRSCFVKLGQAIIEAAVDPFDETAIARVRASLFDKVAVAPCTHPESERHGVNGFMTCGRCGIVISTPAASAKPTLGDRIVPLTGPCPNCGSSDHMGCSYIDGSGHPGGQCFPHVKGRIRNNRPFGLQDAFPSPRLQSDTRRVCAGGEHFYTEQIGKPGYCSICFSPRSANVDEPTMIPVPFCVCVYQHPTTEHNGETVCSRCLRKPRVRGYHLRTP